MSFNFRHGTVGGYQYHGCRCDECRRAATEKMAENRAKRYGQDVPEFVKHGTVSTAFNWGCRCDECLIAASEYNRAARLRRKGANS